MVQALALTRRPSAEQEQTWNIRVKRMAGRSPPQRPTACRDGTERLAACLPRYRADPWSGDTATVPAVLSSRPIALRNTPRRSMPLTIAYGWSLSAQRNARNDMTAEDPVEHLAATTRLASAYFPRNAVTTSEIPQTMTKIRPTPT